jgi:hypothetical protein
MLSSIAFDFKVEFDPLLFLLCPLGVSDLLLSGVLATKLEDFFIVVLFDLVFGEILKEDDTVSPNAGDLGYLGAFLTGFLALYAYCSSRMFSTFFSSLPVLLSISL